MNRKEQIKALQTKCIAHITKLVAIDPVLCSVGLSIAMSETPRAIAEHHDVRYALPRTHLALAQINLSKALEIRRAGKVVDINKQREAVDFWQRQVAER